MEDRARFQRELQDLLTTVNRGFGRGVVAAPMAITAGDEIQGLFRRPRAVVEVVTRIGEALFPVRLVYGLGWGPLATDLGRNVARLDGPCFHEARSALRKAAKDGAWVVAGGFGERADILISALFRLMDEIRSRWKDRQVTYVREARTDLQKNVAARLGVTPSTVSESLKAAGYSALLQGESALEDLLAEFGPETESGASSVARPKRRL